LLGWVGVLLGWAGVLLGSLRCVHHLIPALFSIARSLAMQL
jgi:hypothetical protein